MRAKLLNSVQRVWGGDAAHKCRTTRPFMISAGILALTVAAGLAVGMSDVYAKGGTAKPPGGGGAAPPPAGSCPTGTPSTSACILPPAGPVLIDFPPGAVGALSGNGANGFAITGLVQNVTVTGIDCSVVLTNQPTGLPTPNGGTITVNGVVITIPTNTIVQYPANTLSWADAVCGQTTPLLTGTTRTTPAPPIIATALTATWAPGALVAAT